jgi:hypothetical protein
MKFTSRRISLPIFVIDEPPKGSTKEIEWSAIINPFRQPHGKGTTIVPHDIARIAAFAELRMVLFIFLFCTKKAHPELIAPLQESDIWNNASPGNSSFPRKVMGMRRIDPATCLEAGGKSRIVGCNSIASILCGLIGVF